MLVHGTCTTPIKPYRNHKVLVSISYCATLVHVHVRAVCSSDQLSEVLTHV